MKVKCINNADWEDGYLTIGKEYEVTETFPSGEEFRILDDNCN
jgi:hypothetical protein